MSTGDPINNHLYVTDVYMTGKTLLPNGINNVWHQPNTAEHMRDMVFEELIDIAKENGPLSAEELTYILRASKIVEKLKGTK